MLISGPMGATGVSTVSTFTAGFILVVLTLLIASIYALGAVMQKLTGEKKAAPKAAAPAPAPAPVAAPAPVVEEPAAAEEVVDDAELIAVIAAAIAAFDNSGKTLVVRKVRRVSAWNKSSRQEQVTRF